MARESTPQPVKSGFRGDYHWLVTAESELGMLVRLCPAVCLDRYLAVTSRDSGLPPLSVKQRLAGWTRRGSIAYSPLLRSAQELWLQIDGPNLPGFDEWYLFDTPRDLGEKIAGNPFVEPLRPGRVIDFVNYPDFALDASDPAAIKLAELFWSQLHSIQPESYLADNQSRLTFVTRHPALLDHVRQRLTESLHWDAAALFRMGPAGERS